jgi:hypothetical protein
MHDSSLHITRFSIQVTVAGLIALALPVAPASATYSDYRALQRDYQTCTADLVGVGIAAADAASACAAALAPRDIGECVIMIGEGTVIAATDALSGCRQVRRPVDLAACVVDINTSLQNVVPLDVLSNCRRSLLPTRFSNCVVGISQETLIDPAVAMSTCIVAGDRPSNLLPSFVPSSEPIPSTPSSIPTPSDTDMPADSSPRLTPLVPTQPSQPSGL